VSSTPIPLGLAPRPDASTPAGYRYRQAWHALKAFFQRAAKARGLSASRNNFNGLRLVAALMVVYGHEGIDATGTGGLRLLMFFAISGYLVCGSWRADPQAGRFLARRFLRLWPAYAVCIVVCAALSAAFPAPDMPEMSRLASGFYLKNLWFAGHDWGFFPFRDPFMNQSLWMVGFEVDLYLAFAALAWMQGPLLRLVAAAVLLLALGGTHWDAQVKGGLLECWSLRFAGYFAFGVLLREWPLLRRDTCVAACVLAGAVLVAAGERSAGLMLLIPPAAVWIGEQSWPLLRSAARFGDLSMGIFLWSWPVHQVTLLWIADDTPALLRFVLIVLQATALAWLSWRFIEAPALRLKPGRPAQGACQARPSSVSTASSGTSCGSAVSQGT
jgi:peptidoglycan/LPS O-acetylase OafA/YrhL